VYCNAACAQWVGVPAETLLGERCDYHSAEAEDTARAAACALCPPPGRLVGSPAEMTVSLTAADGAVRRMRATFVPLGIEGADGAGLLAVLASSDGAKADVDPDAAERLHEMVQAFRGRQANAFPLDRLIGESPAMVKARAQARLAAESTVATIIWGPPGSGRKHLASTIHYSQPAGRRGNLVPIDCGVMDADLLHVSLDMMFGRVSRERTEIDTVLAVDVDQLSADGQTVLADFIRRAAGAVRVLAAAETPLDRREGFRRDLAAALGIISIELVPLAARLDDLPALAQLLLEDLNAAGGKQVGGFLPEALDVLAEHKWPGQIDELAAVVSHAHEHAEDGLVGPDDLPPRLRQSVRAAGGPRRAEEPIDLADVLRSVESELIDRAMRRAKGNKAQAARMLGVARARLLRRIEQLGLSQWNRAPQ
ncbi:MAG: helix-turn-helix domain-containing protein, partial [Pirellulales bacterium]